MTIYFQDSAGPIEELTWGRFLICGSAHYETEEGKKGAGKDIRLIGTQVSEWVERHGHLLSPKMITGVYGLPIDVLIIGIGIESRIEVPDAVIQAIHKHGITNLLIESTPIACKKYNQLFHAGKRIALLAHGTC